MQINDLKSELSSIKNENAMLLNNKASHVNELQSLKLKYKDNQSEHNELIETISSYKTLYLNYANCNYFSEAFSAFLVKPCLNISLFIEQVHNELMYLLDKLNTYETQSNSNASKNRAYELEVSELNIQLNNARSELSAIQSHLQKDKKLKSELTN
jgi:chromosome segregation ATPase